MYIFEKIVNKRDPVYSKKNEYGSLLDDSLEGYSYLIDDIELKLDEADRSAELDMIRLSHEEIFGKVRAKLHYEESE